MSRLLAVWCLAVICLVGCERRAAPRLAIPDVPTPTVKATPPPLLGKWVAPDGESMEFTKDGTLVISRSNLPTLSGRYKLLDKSLIEIDLSPDLPRSLKTQTTVKDDDLTIAAKVVVNNGFEVDRLSRWKRAASVESGQSPLEPISKDALLGHWKTSTHQEVYDFYSDGTFVRHIPDQFLAATHLGHWQLNPKTPTTLQLTYPDTGRSESIRVLQSGGGMTVGRDHPTCSIVMLREEKTFTRKAAPSLERQPVQSKLLTAYQVHLEFKTNKEEAEKKYKDKEWEIGGIVRGHVTMGTFEFSRTKKNQEALAHTTVSLATGEDQNVFCVFAGFKLDPFEGGNDPFSPTIPKVKPADKANPFQVGNFVILKGKCGGLIQQTGLFTIGSNTPKVQFTQCTLISPVLKEEKTKEDSK